eukprot:jgi/Mesvir1/19724/Mv09979-RA.2
MLSQKSTMAAPRRGVVNLEAFSLEESRPQTPQGASFYGSNHDDSKNKKQRIEGVGAATHTSHQVENQSADDLRRDGHLAISHPTPEGRMVVWQGSENASFPVDGSHEICTYQACGMLKSEVLESLTQERARVAELDGQVKALTQERSHADKEAMALRRRVVVLEGEVAALGARFSSAQERLAGQLAREEEALKARALREEELRAEVQQAVRAARAAEVAKDAAVAALEKQRAESALREAELTQALAKQRAQVEELSAQLADARAGERDGAAMAEVEVEGARAEADGLMAVVEEQRGALEETQARIAQLEAENAELAAAAHTRASDNSQLARADLVIKELRDELAAGAVELQSYRKLAQEHANVLLLREQLGAAEASVARLERDMRDAAAAQEELVSLRAACQGWADAVRPFATIKGPEELARMVAELQREALLAKAQLGEHQADKVRLEAALEEAHVAVRALEERVAACAATAAESAAAATRLEQKAKMLTIERDGLKQILHNYDEEMAMRGRSALRGTPGTNAVAAAQEGIASTSQMHERERQLQASLAASEDQVRVLEEQVRSLQETASGLRESVLATKGQLEKSQQRNAALEREAQLLAKEVALLEAKVGRGDFNKSTTKVLHLALNPESKIALGAAQEVQALQAKVSQLEAALVSQKGAPVSEAVASGDEATLWKQKAAELEKQKIRYMQVFSSKITSFREACCLLFGYKVDMGERVEGTSTRTTFALRSVYADSDREVLHFWSLPGKDRELEMQAATFINRYRSIPAFTANLTMELFNKHTLG